MVITSLEVSALGKVSSFALRQHGTVQAMTKLPLKLKTLHMHDSANSSLSAQSKFGITRLQPL